jgi:ribosomal protein S20
MSEPELELEDVVEMEGEVENATEEQGLAIQLSVGVMLTINENLDESEVTILKKVNNAVEDAKSGDIAKAKKVVSYANSQIKDLNQKRIAVKNEVMRPLDLIATRIKGIEKKVNDALVPLTTEITAQELKEQTAKLELVKTLKNERLDKESSVISAFIRGCKWFDESSWTNKTTSKAKIVKEMDDKVNAIIGGLQALDLIGEGNKNSSAVSFKFQETGNLSNAIAYRKQLEEADRQEEERKAQVAKENAERLARQQQEEEERQERLAIQAEEREAEARMAKAQADEPLEIHIGTTEVPKFMQEKPIEEEATVEAPVAPEVCEYTLSIRCQKEFLPDLAEFMRNNGCRFRLEKK